MKPNALNAKLNVKYVVPSDLNSTRNSLHLLHAGAPTLEHIKFTVSRLEQQPASPIIVQPAIARKTKNADRSAP